MLLHGKKTASEYFLVLLNHRFMILQCFVLRSLWLKWPVWQLILQELFITNALNFIIKSFVLICCISIAKCLVVDDFIKLFFFKYLLFLNLFKPLQRWCLCCKLFIPQLLIRSFQSQLLRILIYHAHLSIFNLSLKLILDFLPKISFLR